LKFAKNKDRMRNIWIVAIFMIAMTACSDTEKKQSVKVQLIRNATLKLDYNGQVYLIDPVLTTQKSFTSFVVPNQNLNPTIDLPIPLSEITNGVNAFLVTHTHQDHFFFDEKSLTTIDTALPLFAQPFDKQKLSQSAFSNITFIEDSIEFENTTIIRTRGKHGSEQLIQGGLGEVSGFILKAKDYPTIYIVGDCLWDNTIKSTIDKYQPDIIVTNSGGAQWGGETILMDDISTTELAKYAANAKVVAVHMEALDHCTVTRKMLQEACVKENVDIIIPQDGEQVVF
jgi:L-ascorbate metabolism protein UlaG (beta-lactamase superfamily)